MLPEMENALALPRTRRLRPFAPAFPRLLVWAQSLETRVPEQVVLRPLAKCDLGYQAGLNPMNSGATRRFPRSERRFHYFQPIEAPTQID